MPLGEDEAAGEADGQGDSETEERADGGAEFEALVSSSMLSTTSAGRGFLVGRSDSESDEEP